LLYIGCVANQNAKGENMSERRARGASREAIMDAAYRLLAERGYEAATTKEIARAAGVAPGLVHYYFVSKDELVVEMLRRESGRYTAMIQQLAASVPTERLAAAALAEPRERVTRQPEWYRLRYALFALALHNDSVAPGVRSLLAEGRDGIAAAARRALGDDVPDAEATAAVLLACFDGLALQKLLDPDVDLERAYAVLGRMVNALEGQR